MASRSPLLFAQHIERLSVHVHQLGPRATFEAFAELARDPAAGERVAAVLANYQRLTPELLRTVGGHRMVSRRPRAVPAGLEWAV